MFRKSSPDMEDVPPPVGTPQEIVIPRAPRKASNQPARGRSGVVGVEWDTKSWRARCCKLHPSKTFSIALYGEAEGLRLAILARREMDQNHPELPNTQEPADLTESTLTPTSILDDCNYSVCPVSEFFISKQTEETSSTEEGGDCELLDVPPPSIARPIKRNCDGVRFSGIKGILWDTKLKAWYIEKWTDGHKTKIKFSVNEVTSDNQAWKEALRYKLNSEDSDESVVDRIEPPTTDPSLLIDIGYILNRRDQLKSLDKDSVKYSGVRHLTWNSVSNCWSVNTANSRQFHVTATVGEDEAFRRAVEFRLSPSLNDHQESSPISSTVINNDEIIII
jgi:hypothetical protein